MGVALAIGLACVGGGYFLGKNKDGLGPTLAALTDFDKAAAPAQKPATEPKRPEPSRAKSAEKPADKAGLARLLKNADAKPADAPEPKPPAAIPTPPERPETAKAETTETAKSDNGAKSENAKPPVTEAEATAPQAARAVSGDLPAPLAFSLVDRDLSLLDPDRATLALNFENLAGKPIRAFEGVVKYTDLQDHAVYSAPVSVSALIPEGGALRWEQHVETARLDEKGRRLLSEEVANLKAVFLVKKVFFVDGAVQKYAMPRRAAQAG